MSYDYGKIYRVSGSVRNEDGATIETKYIIANDFDEAVSLTKTIFHTPIKSVEFVDFVLMNFRQDEKNDI